jgi:GTP-binding nuclear protein Ran
LQEFVAAPALAPPEVQFSKEDQQEAEKEANEAAAMPLPDEDDADL